jgi:hypothetical protein
MLKLIRVAIVLTCTDRTPSALFRRLELPLPILLLDSLLLDTYRFRGSCPVKIYYPHFLTAKSMLGGRRSP